MTDQRSGRLRSSLEPLLAQLRSAFPAREPEDPQPGYWRNVIVHAVGGTLVVILLHVGPQSTWLGSQQELALDWLIRMYSGVSPSEYRGAPFVFLDVDEASYRQWDEPPITPRDKLQRLLSYSLEGGAALVLVDVDLSRRAGSEDEKLESLLRSTAEGSTPILLARTFREPWPKGSSPWREERTSFLDAVVAAAPDVHWASTLFLREDDRRIRRFRNLEPTCNGGRANVLPAMQLLASVLLLDPENGTTKLETALAGHLPDCSARARGPAPPDVTLQLGDLEIALVGDRTSSRILYNFGGPPGEIAATVPFEGRETPILTRIPAHRLTEASSSRTPSWFVDGSS